MKYLISIFFSLATFSSFACSCFEERSFCDHIQDSYFTQNGIVCVVEATGNVSGDYDFSAAEVRIVELLHGQVQSGDGNYLNTDSTIWIIAGQGATCYESAFIFYNPGERFVIAPTYADLYRFDNTTETIETGYSLFLCTNDFFRTSSTIDQLQVTVDNCIDCITSLTLSDTHDFPSIYNVSSTILSTAIVNSNVVYKADDRVTLYNGFKTNTPYNFKVKMDGCN